EEGDYLRYKLTTSGISTMASPGDVDRRFTADGLEHNEKGTPSAKQSDHQSQLDKRADKLADFDFGEDWGCTSGSGSVALLCFGSSSAPVAEAAALLTGRGVDARVISLRLLAPLQVVALTDTLAGCEQLIVVEQNHSGQLFHYLKGQMDFQQQVHSYAMAGPVPLNPQSIAQRVLEVTGK
ncbi:MAG: 2-oxoacid:acceptor oxidoreductase subunit alpha, partial [Gammaproteobacteria bacterium]